METKNVDTEAVKTPKKPGPKPKATQTSAAPKPASKQAVKTVRLDDHVMILARSNQYGSLVFVNPRTHDKVVWNGINDEQELSVVDIRAMKTNARKFFSEPWIEIESIVTPGYEDITKEELLTTLGLMRYYSSSKRPANLSDVLEWDVETIKAKVPEMTKDTKDNISIAVAEAVRDGDINALDQIRAWEEVLGRPFLTVD